MLTKEERKLLEKYITNVDSNIFAIKGLQGIVGSAFARYSRAKGSFKETLLKEFLKEGVLDPRHAEELIERILVAYGDDSVGELEGAHVSFEDISNLATKTIEDRRIGGSPIEQSSRYVFYDQQDEKVASQAVRSEEASEGGFEAKDSEAKTPQVSAGLFAEESAVPIEKGKWKYLRPKEIMESAHAEAFEKGMDQIFQIYHDLIEPVTQFYEQKKSIEEAEYDVLGTGKKQKLKDLKDEKDIKAFKRTYSFDLKTKTCDTIRVILPTATLTQVGMFGNGRYYQELLSHLYTQELHEMQDIASKCHSELKKIIAPFVRRAKRNEWLAERRKLMRELGKAMFQEKVEKTDDITVHLMPMSKEEISPEEYFFINSLAQMVYPYTEVSLSKIIEKISKSTDEERYEILESYVGSRKHRRHRPDRALEAGYPLVFDITTDFGSYRDLHRHRMFTQQRQLITPNIGFVMPQDLIEAGVQEKILQARSICEDLYKKIRDYAGPLVAQYVVLFGYNIRWTIGANLRALEHMIELRTTPQGHPNYRKVCQLMAKAILERFPWTSEILKFTDFNAYTWARADSEARQRVKERELDEKWRKN